MLAFRRISSSTRGQAIVELTLTLPLLIVLGLGAIEFGNMINAYLVLTHLTREGANLTSRQDGTKGTSAWRDKINADLQAAVDAAGPIITSTNLTQWKVTYSMVVWDTVLGASCGNLNPSVGGGPDRYVIERNNSTWGANNPTWIRGSLGPSDTNIGADGACAFTGLPGIKDMPALQTLHVVEVFYDYGPSRLTPIQSFVGNILPTTFYTRTVFTDVSGRG
jgi:Flp pilus assembly protein TadG